MKWIALMSLVAVASVGLAQQAVESPVELSEAPVVAAPVDAVVVAAPVVVDPTVALKEKDQVIQKLSVHLESALTRLNQKGTAEPVSQQTAVLLALKTRLEKENAMLKESNETLKARFAESQKRAQLFDLENRKLVEAISGSSKQVVERLANEDKSVAPARSFVTHP